VAGGYQQTSSSFTRMIVNGLSHLITTPYVSKAEYYPPLAKKEHYCKD